MKKFMLFVLALLLLCSTLVPAQASDFSLSDFLNSMYNTSSDIMPKNIKMPQQFSIKYEYVEDGKYREVTMECDLSGNYHYKDNEDEYLFVKSGSGYKIAINTLNGFAYKSNDKYTFDYIKSLTKKFWECALPLDDDYIMGTTTEEGTVEICGRTANRFKVEIGLGYNFGGYNVSMSDATYYDFDAETGICMATSSSENINYMGLSSNDDQSGFSCIHFRLSSISLPTAP